MMNFRRSFFYSLSLHAVLIMLVITYPFIYKAITNQSLFESNLRQIPEAVKVDLVGMPTLTIKELENLPRINAEKMHIEKTTEIDTSRLNEEKSSEKAEKSEEEKEKVEEKEDTIKQDDIVLQKNEKSKKIKKSNKKNKSKFSKENKKEAAESLRSLFLLGNKLSKGELAVGEVSDVDLSEIDSYALKLKNKIRPFWNLPSFLLDLELRCRVRIYINKEGELIRMALIEKSGNEEYDGRVRKAIELAEPFDVPDEKIQEELENGNLVLVFPF